MTKAVLQNFSDWIDEAFDFIRGDMQEGRARGRVILAALFLGGGFALLVAVHCAWLWTVILCNAWLSRRLDVEGAFATEDRPEIRLNLSGDIRLDFQTGQKGALGGQLGFGVCVVYRFQ